MAFMSEIDFCGTIGPEERFYGYIVGLHLEHAEGDLELPAKAYARFEYGNTTSVWLVPDYELFRILSEHLKQNAWCRLETDDNGYNKVWIEKLKDGTWSVSLP